MTAFFSLSSQERIEFAFKMHREGNQAAYYAALGYLNAQELEALDALMGEYHANMGAF